MAAPEATTPRAGWRAEVTDTLETLEGELNDLVVRGLSACGRDDVRVLDAARVTLKDAGAAHVAERIKTLLDLVQGGDKAAPHALLSLVSSLRVFERVLTLEGVAETLRAEDAPPATTTTTTTTTAARTTPAPKAASPLPRAEAQKLLPVLDALAAAVCDLVAAGLVAASQTTKQKLEVAFKEASRLKLGRLAASLRYVMEEIQRFLDGSAHFSGKRLALFVNRSWVLARGLSQAIVEENDALLSRLLWSFPQEPVARVDVVCVGVRKRLPQGTGIVAFDFHLRAVAGDRFAYGTPLVWSHIVPKKDAKITAEALLHLELKPQQKTPGDDPRAGAQRRSAHETPPERGFKPLALTGGNVVSFHDVAVIDDGSSTARLVLTPSSTLVEAARFDGWSALFAAASLDRAAIVSRVERHAPSPLDLEVELAVEAAVVVSAVARVVSGDDVDRAVVTAALEEGGLALDVNLAKTDESRELRAALSSWRDGVPAAPLFGVLHFDRCRLVFQPLSLLEESGPRHVMLTLEKIDLAALARSLF